MITRTDWKYLGADKKLKEADVIHWWIVFKNWTFLILDFNCKNLCLSDSFHEVIFSLQILTFKYPATREDFGLLEVPCRHRQSLQIFLCFTSEIFLTMTLRKDKSFTTIFCHNFCHHYLHLMILVMPLITNINLHLITR